MIGNTLNDAAHLMHDARDAITAMMIRIATTATTAPTAITTLASLPGPAHHKNVYIMYSSAHAIACIHTALEHYSCIHCTS